MNISVVIPLLNESDSLTELHDWIAKVMQSNHFSYEIIFIDDGSTDKSWETIQMLSQKDDKVKGIRFLKNFGKSHTESLLNDFLVILIKNTKGIF